MAGMVVSASKGVMESVLAKLTELIGDECANLMGVSNDIRFLREELPEMNALLEKLDDTDELDPQVKSWRNQVREMTYDIEDSIDYFKNNVGNADAKAGLISKASHFLMTLRERLAAAKQMKELRTRLQEINDRRKRYKVDGCSSSSVMQTLDPRLPALYSEADRLVGIENPKEELIKMVMDGDQQSKVISVVGSGGLGKTTLANEVYREIGERFDCKAFASISSTPDMTRIFIDVLKQLGQDPTLHYCDVKDLINSLREYLHEKRYLIIVDDLWDDRWWNIISCAFCPDDRYSRVLITTRNIDVARACCSDHRYIYEMRPLSDPNSKKLFLKRLSISEDDPGDSNEVVCQILKKCGGLPLAIITIASILACQDPIRLTEQWEYIQNSLADQSATNHKLEDMVHILELSYKSLPRYIKTCFLYLGKYPEDHIIKRNELVRQWVAEGFVSNSSGRDVWKVAEGYFNMLVNRSMIQPVYDAYNIEVSHCRVHDMMLELILRRCREDNLIIVARDPHEVAKAQYKVRRFSVDLSGSVDVQSADLYEGMCKRQERTASQLAQMPRSKHSAIEQCRRRKINDGGCIDKFMWLGYAPRYYLLRLEVYLRWSALHHKQKHAKLPHLKYLKVVCNQQIIELPSEIGRLQYLETVELPSRLGCRFIPPGVPFPPDVIDLPRLSHLVVPWNVSLPDGIGKMKSLRTLRGFSLGMSSSENIKDLGGLTNLESLKLHGQHEWPCTLTTAPSTCMDALSSCLDKLSNLKLLSFYIPYGLWRADALSSLSPTFHNLERLYIFGAIFPRVPRWISDLHQLYTLYLVVDEISNSSWQDIGIVGALPSLVRFCLYIPRVPAERIVISGSKGFTVLRDFEFNCDGISYLTFEAGAMPNLWSLSLCFDPCEWDKAPPNGLHHLPSLKQISAKRAGSGPSRESWEEVNMTTGVVMRGVLGGAADALPTRPAFVLRSGWLSRG